MWYRIPGRLVDQVNKFCTVATSSAQLSQLSPYTQKCVTVHIHIANSTVTALMFTVHSRFGSPW